MGQRSGLVNHAALYPCLHLFFLDSKQITQYILVMLAHQRAGSADGRRGLAEIPRWAGNLGVSQDRVIHEVPGITGMEVWVAGQVFTVELNLRCDARLLQQFRGFTGVPGQCPGLDELVQRFLVVPTF